MIEIKRVLPVSKTLDQPIKAIKYLAVHCSATPSNQDLGAIDINRMHVARGFLRVGYHYVIRRDGTIEKGREDTQIGAHVQGYNSNSLGICLIGGVDKPEDVTRNSNGAVITFISVDNYTPAQKAALVELLKHLKKTYPKAIIQGHRDFPDVAKDCPCYDIRAWLKEVAPALL